MYSLFNNLIFLQHNLAYLKATGLVSDLPISDLSTLLFKLIKPNDAFFNLSI